MRKIKASVAFVSVLAGVLFSSQPGRANGRFPQAMQLAEDPSNPNRLWLRTTYGLVMTSDRGANWNWICEDAMGFNSTKPFDPTFAVQGNGTVILGTLGGVMRGRNGGCSWDLAAAAGKFLLDLAVDPSNKARAVGIVSQLAEGASTADYVNEIWETTNNGENFALLANNFPKTMFSTTLDLVAGDANRIYVSGLSFDGGTFVSPLVPVFLRSNDHGKSWQRVDFQGLATPLAPSTEPYIAAIHPTNPDIVYVRTLERKPDNTVPSRLLYTSNGGDSWQEILSGPAPMLGFAISPDGTEIAAGFGNPGDRPDYVFDETKDFGLLRSPAPNFNFQKVLDKSVSGLTWSERGLYVCSRIQSSQGGFVVGYFDLGYSTATCPGFQVLQNRTQVNGPLACATGTSVQTLCTPQKWQAACDFNQLGCGDAGANLPHDAGAPTCEDPVPGDAGVPDASVGGSSGTGASGTGGTTAGGTNSGGNAGSGGSSQAQPQSSEEDGGCSCRTAGGPTTPSEAARWLIAGLAAAIAICRRSARTQCRL